MQIYTIVIGGLEKSYMQKLVLYLNERLGKSARVELLEHWEIPEQPEVWEMKKQSVGVPMEPRPARPAPAPRSGCAAA